LLSGLRNPKAQPESPIKVQVPHVQAAAAQRHARQEAASAIGLEKAGPVLFHMVEILKGRKPRRADDAEAGRRSKTVPVRARRNAIRWRAPAVGDLPGYGHETEVDLAG
jgi:hypothetical protein